jgi:hypothetical protein
VLPEDLVNQSVRLKEEQLRREEEKLREVELRVQREINEKTQQLLAKEETLRYVYYSQVWLRASLSYLFSAILKGGLQLLAINLIYQQSLSLPGSPFFLSFFRSFSREHSLFSRKIFRVLFEYFALCI